MPAYTEQFWAKAFPYGRRGPERIHLLEHHLADVGACFEALILQPTIRERVATAGGLEDLDESLVARLSLFAALHDIGKANMGFQTRIWRPEELPGGKQPTSFLRVGHTRELVPVLTDQDRTTAGWFFEALGWDDFLTWDDDGGETVCAMLVATLSHHGRPLQLDGGLAENPAIWRKFGGLDPKEFVERVGHSLRHQWFPAAFAQNVHPIPSAPAFQHMFLGLCNWADWIGSDERIFKYWDEPRDDYIETARERAGRAVHALGLKLAAQRDSIGGVPEFRELFGLDGPPNAIQQKTTWDTPLDRRLVIIESETGSGKTEAALWRFARMYDAGLVDGLYFALPTRSAAVQIHQRVKYFVSNLFPHHAPPVVLAVPGYEPGADAANVAMQDYKPWWEGDNDERIWASESPKKFLAAQVAVGTVDQAMMGALQVKNAHMRAACLARNLLVVDEVHASDTYMSVILEALLDAHLGAGGYALLMSATLGSVARHRWLHRGKRADQSPPTLCEAKRAHYPAVSAVPSDGETLTPAGENDQEKTVTVSASPTMDEFQTTACRALTAARDGAKVLVVRNTVDHAVRTQMALENLAKSGDAGLLFDIAGNNTLHHGRFAACDRAMLDKRVEELFGKGRKHGGRVIVGTQTLEQSLDIDADLLITDLCPVDVLLQRIGRLHRHKRSNRPGSYARPSCVVLTPPNNDLEPLLIHGGNANGLGPKGYVYEDLRTLEATRRLIGKHAEWRIPEMNRLLVEHATHPDALNAISEELGEDWMAHSLDTEGGEIADKLHGRGHTIKRDKSFLNDNREVLFIVDEERIRTRLGDDRIDIALDPPQPSPFDTSKRVNKLAVSVRWLPAGDAPESAAPSPMDSGGFTLAIGDRRFVYDRLGLRRET